MRLCVSDYYEFYVGVSDSVLLISEKSYFFLGGGRVREGGVVKFLLKIQDLDIV